MLYAVLGDGEMATKELNETLVDLWEKNGDEPFWFLLLGKSEPTDTDKALVKWLGKNEIYFEILTDDADAVDEVYAGGQKTHTAKRLAQKLSGLLDTLPERGSDDATENDSGSTILALFVSDDPTAEEDRWLSTTIQAVANEDIKALVLNDGLVEIDLSEEAAAAEAEPEETPAPAKKAASKKAPVAPSKKAAPKPAAPEEPEPDEVGGYSREGLEEMELGDLKEIAAKLDITLPPRTRAATYIDAILGEGKPTEAEVAPEPEPDLGEDGEPADAAAFAADIASQLAIVVVKEVKKAIQEMFSKL